MRLALRVGLVDRPAPHKFHARPTPYLGGLAILVSVMGAIVGAMALNPSIRSQYMAIGLGATAMAAVGLLDDWLTLRATPRILVQVVAALGLWSVGIRLTPTGVHAADLVVTVLVVVAITNSVNLLDNMDGLSTGVVAIASLYLFVVATAQGQHLVDVMALVLGGACLGFLPYNFSPARIFLGDSGTLFMGFLLSSLVLKVNLVGFPLASRVVVPGLILFVPLFDMSLVVLSRWRGGRGVFAGGTDHSSHRIVSLGLTPRDAAEVSYAVALAAGGLGILLVAAHSVAVTLVVAIPVVATTLVAMWYLELAHRRGAPTNAPAGAPSGPPTDAQAAEPAAGTGSNPLRHHLRPPRRPRAHVPVRSSTEQS
jgi:UDP-GlcNAc:undecaprenyl-phosphate GlcNAc-1-phosphate transferase